MLIHLTPKLFINPRHIDPQHDIPCELLDIQCPELGLCLHGGEDVVACRPYPNKGYHVARRKVGRKAVNGVLVQTAEFLSTFTLTTHWIVYGDPDQGNPEQVLTHRVHYTVRDDEHEAVSDCMLLWYGRDGGGHALALPLARGHERPTHQMGAPHGSGTRLSPPYPSPGFHG